ncbi:MAG: biopolymer transport protein TolQ [Alphaproteobacteria bacterium]|jgi:biopolymer transport protein TolQ
MTPLAEPIQSAATTAVQAAHDLTVMGLFSQADIFVKTIMLLLIGLSIVTWAILINKYNVFRKLRHKAQRFEEAFWGNRGLEELYKNTKPEETDHPMAKLYVIGLREWEQAKDENTENKNYTLQVGVPDRVRQLMGAKMNRELERLENSMPVLATVGSTAPFIGLLGTVWGIMSSFNDIGATKNTSLAVVAPGIAEALFATALGLFAAIPAVVAYNKLSTELGRYAARLESFVTEFVTLLERQHQESVVSASKTTNKLRTSDKTKEAS